MHCPFIYDNKMGIHALSRFYLMIRGQCFTLHWIIELQTHDLIISFFLHGLLGT